MMWDLILICVECFNSLNSPMVQDVLEVLTTKGISNVVLILEHLVRNNKSPLLSCL